MQRFADPALFEQLTNSEKAIGALITTILGMGITFIVLALLWGLIAVVTKLMNVSQKDTNTSTNNVVLTEKSTETTLNGEENMTNENPELIAVIMAAIAASEGGEFKNNLIIRKINRIAGAVPAWGKAGGLDCIDSRKI